MQFLINSMLLLLTTIAASHAYGDQRTADQIAQQVMRINERIWKRTLLKPLEIQLEQEGRKRDPRYPSFWNPKGEKYIVSLLENFDLEKTWWNMKPEDKVYSRSLKNASLKQKYVLVLSHEITHLFTFPSPWRPWFQEIIGMKIGRQIAVELEPSLALFFLQPTEEVKLEQLVSFDYNEIRPPNIEACRKFQREAYWYSMAFKAEDLIKWARAVVNGSAEYVPWADHREANIIDGQLLSVRPQ